MNSAVVTFIFCLIALFFSAHPLLSIFSFVSLFWAYKLFWKEDQPKTIFLGLLFFWLTIPIKIFYADIYGLDYESLSRSPKIVHTTFISIVGFIVFYLGIYTAVRNLKIKQRDKDLRKILLQYYDSGKIIYIYIYSFFITLAIKAIMWLVPSLTQLFAGFIEMKLGFIFLLTLSTVLSKKYRLITVTIFLFEIAISFFSIFSNFKDIIITIIVGVTVFNIFNNPKRLLGAAIIILFAGYFFLAWQAVKGEYRNYLTGGEKTQLIVVEQKDALEYLKGLFVGVQVFGNEKLLFATVDRISYIEFFSQSTDRVPAYTPYQDGELWKQNVLHVLEPRIFFPNKPAIDDSKMVNDFATQRVSGANKGVTFSLGFMAESYIDYGELLMFIPIFLLGLLIGIIYRAIMRQSINYLWGTLMTVPLWHNINCNGTPGTKVLGWLLTYYIAFFIFRKFFMKRVDEFILKGPEIDYGSIN